MFLYDNGKMFDINALVTGFSQVSGDVFLNAFGQIVGAGTINGQVHAFLLTYEADANNVPEPASIALLCIGLLGVAAVRRKRSQ